MQCMVYVYSLGKCLKGNKVMQMICYGRLSEDRQDCPYDQIVVEKPHGEKASQQLVDLIIISY